MGKYAAVLQKLPPWVNPDLERQSKVDEVKQEIRSTPESPLPDEVRLEFIGEKMRQVIENIAYVNHLLLELPGPRFYASVIARAYREVRAVVETLDELQSHMHLTKEAYEQLLILAYEAEGVNSLKLATGERVRIEPQPYAQVMDKEAFRQWCVAQGLERSMHLMWQTTNSLVKERLLKGEPEPDGIEAKMKHKIVLSTKE
jgi:hypothetical protein